MLWLMHRNSLFFILEQEDKEPVFDSVKTIMGMLEVSAEFAENITYNQERIRSALPAGHLDATTLADYLVKKVYHILLQIIHTTFIHIVWHCHCYKHSIIFA